MAGTSFRPRGRGANGGTTSAERRVTTVVEIDLTLASYLDPDAFHLDRRVRRAVADIRPDDVVKLLVNRNTPTFPGLIPSVGRVQISADDATTAHAWAELAAQEPAVIHEYE